jgi:copper transport protein
MSAGLVIVVGVWRIVAQTLLMRDSLGVASVASMAMTPTWGAGWAVHLVGGGIAAAGFARARGGARGGWATATAGAVMLAFAPALGGHALATPRVPAVAVLLDGAHVLGAAAWLGSLLALVVAGVPATRAAPSDRGRRVADLVMTFSPAALAAAALVLVTGVISAWLHVGSLDALWSTTYGRTLLIKFALLVCVAGAGAYNWRRIRPSLGDAGSATRIQRTAGVELALGAAVVIVTAVLIGLPPPRS